MAFFEYISRLIDDPDPVIVTPYGGYANEKSIHAQARVLEDEGIKHTEEDSVFKNLYNSYKRFESDEKEGATVKVSWGNKKTILTSDDEGYIYLDQTHHLDVKHQETLWIPVTYELIEGNTVIYKITSPVMKPSPLADFGVISDLDDTVIETGVSSTFKWQLIVNSFMKHSHKRLPLEGVQEFYNLLHKGITGYNDNPFFYLSNSPWNIHDYLSAFLKKFNFPKGVLLLRDIGFNKIKSKHFTERNKYLKISHILTTYPNMKFILIGDAADLDPDIYIKIAQSFPQQVLSIYIRTVNNTKRTERAKKVIEENTHVKVILTEGSKKAIDHARTNGFIK
ncbi:App1 family protein [Abyssalbus ytuae]|uniref:DUF2183 domain-containing protein n=1 Tax=Abyssalbus ytuae TaxID=2926907 RepID=A0A9E7D391_9FLAO|nr:phosphatase domain-containing protein [Abyssalbus ytuae]UOB17589.1 DUF2183 domain-containing protein [Abyssalbus ytuae]